MSFETAPLRGVSNQYGARHLGGFQGGKRTSGLTHEATVNFDGDVLPTLVPVPAGAIVTEVNDSFATGTAIAFVGAVDVSAADGSAATAVPVPLGGDLQVTGPTAGTVIVKYEYTAASVV